MLSLELDIPLILLLNLLPHLLLSDLVLVESMDGTSSVNSCLAEPTTSQIPSSLPALVIWLAVSVCIACTSSKTSSLDVRARVTSSRWRLSFERGLWVTLWERFPSPLWTEFMGRVSWAEMRLSDTPRVLQVCGGVCKREKAAEGASRGGMLYDMNVQVTASACDQI